MIICFVGLEFKKKTNTYTENSPPTPPFSYRVVSDMVLLQCKINKEDKPASKFQTFIASTLYMIFFALLFSILRSEKASSRDCSVPK